VRLHCRWALYPAPRTVSIRSCSPSLRLTCATCTSTCACRRGRSVPRPRRADRSRREHEAGILDQDRQQIELLVGQLDLFPVYVTSCSARVEFDLAEAKYFKTVTLAAATEDRVGARDQLAWREGLGDVVVGPSSSPVTRSFSLATSRKNDDRYLRASSNQAADFEAVDPRSPISRMTSCILWLASSTSACSPV